MRLPWRLFHWYPGIGIWPLDTLTQGERYLLLVVVLASLRGRRSYANGAWSCLCVVSESLAWCPRESAEPGLAWINNNFSIIKKKTLYKSISVEPVSSTHWRAAPSSGLIAALHASVDTVPKQELSEVPASIFLTCLSSPPPPSWEPGKCFLTELHPALAGSLKRWEFIIAWF